MMRVAIVGLGLIGGSMGMALRHAGSGNMEVTGWARRAEVARQAAEMGAVDRVEQDLAFAVGAADIVVLATPVLAMRDMMQRIRPHLAPGCVVTDVASTKVEVLAWAREHLPAGIDFVGGHPMAGKEVAGIEAAEAALFRGCIYCLVPGEGASPGSVQKMVDLVRMLGAESLFIDAEEHDAAVAGISHLPLIASTALLMSTARSPSWPQMSKLAATGYRGVTRLASQHPTMNRDICITNGSNIVAWVERFIEELRRLQEIVARAVPEDVEGAFAEAREARQRWLESHDKGDPSA